MSLKPDKCEFMVTKTLILNHLVEFRKIYPNQVKIKEAEKLKPPTDVNGVRRFTGFMNYFRKYIQNFAQIAQPIYNLLKKNV